MQLSKKQRRLANIVIALAAASLILSSLGGSLLYLMSP
jgi:hypothetical protein